MFNSVEARRRFLLGTGALLLSSRSMAIENQPDLCLPGDPKLIAHTIPKTGELLPAIGMGTWITFNVGRNQTLRQQRGEVLQRFFAMGGTLVDSSPMYGSSEEVLGDILKVTGSHTLFSATKTWTSSNSDARNQFADSKVLWGIPKFDLLQIHNLLAWKNHMSYLRELKEQGAIKYIGVTTSHGRRHSDIKRILNSQDVDFLQLTYNLSDRDAANELIPLAKERGVAVICNRPFKGGRLPKISSNAAVPIWAQDLGCSTWPQLLLKYLISTPGVIAAIPATSKVEHMQENMTALYGELPDAKLRKRIITEFEAI